MKEVVGSKIKKLWLIAVVASVFSVGGSGYLLHDRLVNSQVCSTDFPITLKFECTDLAYQGIDPQILVIFFLVGAFILVASAGAQVLMGLYILSRRLFRRH